MKFKKLILTPFGSEVDPDVKNIIARDVSWASSVFRGTPAAASLGGYGGGVGNPTNRRGSGVQ